MISYCGSNSSTAWEEETFLLICCDVYHVTAACFPKQRSHVMSSHQLITLGTYHCHQWISFTDTCQVAANRTYLLNCMNFNQNHICYLFNSFKYHISCHFHHLLCLFILTSSISIHSYYLPDYLSLSLQILYLSLPNLLISPDSAPPLLPQAHANEILNMSDRSDAGQS